jgi:hypothetical protein
MATTTIQLTVDNSIIPQAVAALNWKHGYAATLPDGTTNPVTPAQDAKACIKDFVKNAITEYNNMSALQAVTAPQDNLFS